MNSFYEYIKIIFICVLSALEVLASLLIAILTLYYLIGAFMPYKTVEYNLANLLLFLACVSYWVWLYQTRNEDVSFWKSF